MAGREEMDCGDGGQLSGSRVADEDAAMRFLSGLGTWLRLSPIQLRTMFSRQLQPPRSHIILVIE